jgi:ribulose-bisphosphate carboxylase small chain
MRLTQGTFSFLPDLTDEEIRLQLEYCLENEWAISIEYTDDPHPRNTYWEMWGLPMFDLVDPAGILDELRDCRASFPKHYIRVNAFDATHGVESVALSFIANRPPEEPGFRLVRAEEEGRRIRYTTESYAVQYGPEGERYGPAQ